MVTYIYNNSTQVVEAGKFEFKDSLCCMRSCLKTKQNNKKTKWSVCVNYFQIPKSKKLRETTKHY